MKEEQFVYTKEDIQAALEALQRGEIILYPTDTIWGIGCDATNTEAVKKIYAIKQREDAKALISIIDSNAKLQGLMDEVPELAYDLTELATEPLTIIYPNVRGLAPNLLAEDGSAGIRICNEPFCKVLCQRFKKPIVSTSANISGETAPRFFTEISPAIIEAVDYIVRYRRDDNRPHSASKIMKLNIDGSFVLIR
ncbi:L-threonylcarbamoyladenylate synthase [Porphyromonas sp.]|uniref:L-threonylcarbamoyladenylate synthase n=1 Tax=Porphyromonas sp. TaxID=1924944 RepID=UPI0026DC9F86|nr:L-threonylcarbamoyladenylate synthase [Porphyromonas sp.]MDO4770456.1 L-threonylcarbamoyladenylate synthase [Porphyromonas sp.]